MTIEEIKRLTEKMRKSGVIHLVFADTDDHVLTSINCSPEQLYVFLRVLVERIPSMADVITEVACDLYEEGCASDGMVN